MTKNLCMDGKELIIQHTPLASIAISSKGRVQIAVQTQSKAICGSRLHGLGQRKRVSVTDQSGSRNTNSSKRPSGMAALLNQETPDSPKKISVRMIMPSWRSVVATRAAVRRSKYEHRFSRDGVVGCNGASALSTLQVWMRGGEE